MHVEQCCFRRSRAVILHPRRARLTSRLCDHVRESAEPVGARWKRDQISLAPRVSSAVAQQHLDHGGADGTRPGLDLDVGQELQELGLLAKRCSNIGRPTSTAPG